MKTIKARHLAETEDPTKIDDDPALNPYVEGDNDGLDDLIFVIDDGQGGEQILNLGNEPMDVDVGVGQLVINVCRLHMFSNSDIPLIWPKI